MSFHGEIIAGTIVDEDGALSLKTEVSEIVWKRGPNGVSVPNEHDIYVYTIGTLTDKFAGLEADPNITVLSYQEIINETI